VNALVRDPASDRLWLATSKGVSALEGSRQSQTLTESNGLIGENAAAVCPLDDPGSIAIATNKGITVYERSVARSISAFHGLPNNHAYSLARVGGKLYAGTLGGLAEIEGLRVTRVYSTANSTLPHNWVNALAVSENRLFVGTYGGGVAELSSTGELTRHSSTEGTDVNPGAMHCTEDSLFVGTLANGALVLDLESGTWRRITSGLASRNVTAITAVDGYVYIGTEQGITRIELDSLQ
jgi:ligand-binding sensor domain-containing protein